MNTCDTCQYWDTSEIGIVFYQSGHCRNPKLTQIGHCRNPKLTQMQCGTDGLFAESGDETVIPRTAPKFGCIHHDPIQQSTKPRWVSLATEDRLTVLNYKLDILLADKGIAVNP